MPNPSRLPVHQIQSHDFQECLQNEDIDRWKGVYLVDDLSPEAQKERKMTRAIYAHAKSQGLDVKTRGSHLIVDGVKYKPTDELPHGLCIQAAKTIQVADGVAFQGEYAPYSNHHYCEFEYKNIKYTSSEKALQNKKAVICKHKHVSKQIMATDDIQLIMRLGNSIMTNNEWNNNSDTYLADI